MPTKRKQKPIKTAARRPTKQRIINLTVTRLRELAKELTDGQTIAPRAIALDLERWAAELDAGADGRETQEKRKNRKAER